MNEQRPNPDELLDRVKREEEKSRRGRLKVYFGSSAGVGKTYAMLSAARQLRAQGLDTVVGIVETHGRPETMALLDGMEILPPREVNYHNTSLREFDLDGALKRRPALILVDELAHSNVQGSRHPKRCNDVEELLDAGINVYTTVNVQHLESLNDIVSSITGIRIGETVPDRIFDQADEVVLVDITPDELLQRFKEGKVYMPEQAERAIRNFFRKGNLIALRELSLRRTADRVDDQMRTYRHEQSLEVVWQTKESLVVGVGPGSGGKKIVRGASRLAANLGVEWHAVYIETPKLQRLPESERGRILQILRFAHELGAKTSVLTGQSAAEALVDYARSHNLTKIIVGRSKDNSLNPCKRAFAEQVGRLSPDIDVVQIAQEKISGNDTMDSGEARSRHASVSRKSLWPSYAWSAGACCITASLAALALPYFDLANIVMLFLLTVVIVAVKFGRGPAVLTAFVSVALFDFFFVPPRFSFAVSDVQYLLTFAVMLAVALIIGHLTANLRYQARVASHREKRLRALYEMARDLSSALMPEKIAAISYTFLKDVFSVKAAILIVNEQDKLQTLQTAGNPVPVIDQGIAQWSFDHAEPAGFSTDTLPGSPILYLPLSAPMRTRGVLAIEPIKPRWLLIPEQRRQLDAFATLIATALERIHYIDVAQNTLLKFESERLRNSVLSVLSHDMRTPLTAIAGLVDSLTRSKPTFADAQLELLSAIRGQIFRINAMVNNLLDMARLQAGDVSLNLQWQPVDEVLDCALTALGSQLANHQVDVALPPDLPLLEYDAVLIERVLYNLLENCAKYTPLGSSIKICASIKDGEVQISITDNGPGLASGSEEQIFDKFTRGKMESATPGVGLGLAICRTIIKAHNGRIWAENIPEGGARFVFTLPVGNPPTLENLHEEEVSK